MCGAYASEEELENEGTEGGVLVAGVGEHGGEVGTGRGAITEHRDLLYQREDGLQARTASASVPRQSGKSVLGCGRAEVGKDAADCLNGDRNVRWARLQLSETAVTVIRAHHRGSGEYALSAKEEVDVIEGVGGLVAALENHGQQVLEPH